MSGSNTAAPFWVVSAFGTGNQHDVVLEVSCPGTGDRPLRYCPPLLRRRVLRASARQLSSCMENPKRASDGRMCVR